LAWFVFVCALAIGCLVFAIRLRASFLSCPPLSTIVDRMILFCVLSHTLFLHMMMILKPSFFRRKKSHRIETSSMRTMILLGWVEKIFIAIHAFTDNSFNRSRATHHFRPRLRKQFEKDGWFISIQRFGRTGYIHVGQGRIAGISTMLLLLLLLLQIERLYLLQTFPSFERIMHNGLKNNSRRQECQRIP